jgi:hypothetical protein
MIRGIVCHGSFQACAAFYNASYYSSTRDKWRERGLKHFLNILLCILHISDHQICFGEFTIWCFQIAVALELMFACCAVAVGDDATPFTSSCNAASMPSSFDKSAEITSDLRRALDRPPASAGTVEA